MQNPIAVISGATKGIGRAIADRFSREGFDLFVAARTEADLQAMTGENPNSATKIHGFVADFGKKEDVLAFADFIKKHSKRVDCLVNNAGIYLPGNVSNEADGTLERLMEVNLYGSYWLTRALLPLLFFEKQSRPQPPHIFNMCSIASVAAYPNGGAYSISKFALLGFSKNLRLEMQPLGVKVTAILPGATWSDSWAGVDLPAERLMQAVDIADILWAMWNLSPSAVAEEVILRPQLGDL